MIEQLSKEKCWLTGLFFFFGRTHTTGLLMFYLLPKIKPRVHKHVSYQTYIKSSAAKKQILVSSHLTAKNWNGLVCAQIRDFMIVHNLTTTQVMNYKLLSVTLHISYYLFL